MREIVFDTETTGLSAKDGDRLVEIGCVELIGRIPSGNTFHCYYNPERDMPLEAERVHGLSSTFLADKPVFADGADELLAFIGDAPLIAHNASFDFGFLNAELERAGHAPVSLDRMVDTLAIARKAHPGAKLSLDALCTRYGIDRSHRTKHGALLDAELLTQLYIELTGGRQIGLGLAEQNAEKSVEKVTLGSASHATRGADPSRTLHAASAIKREYREPRLHSASAAEIARHNEFIAQMDAPIWRS